MEDGWAQKNIITNKVRKNIMLVPEEQMLMLRGMTLRGSVRLKNPNENLAVIFEVQPPQGLQITLCIEPRRGIIMQMESKDIKIWVRAEDRQKAITNNFVGKPLRISMTMKAQYNRKLMERNNIQGWQKIKKSYETIQLPIVISTQASSIRETLRQEASSSIQKESRDLGYGYSENFKSRSHPDQIRTSSVMQRGGGSVSKFNQKKISDRLEKELDFLFVGHMGKESRSSQNNHNNYKDQFNLLDKMAANELTTPITNKSPMQQQWSPSPITPNISVNSPDSKEGVTPMSSPSERGASNQRFMEVIMLAALAGFFAALGSNLRNLFH